MSSRIFENLSRISRNNTTGFDFTKSAESNNFPYKQKGYLDNSAEELPILAKESTWKVEEDQAGQFLRKKYKFIDKNHMLYFLEESINQSESESVKSIKLKNNMAKTKLEQAQTVGKCAQTKRMKFMNHVDRQTMNH